VGAKNSSGFVDLVGAGSSFGPVDLRYRARMSGEI